MKKILLTILLCIVILVPSLSYALPTQWDRFIIGGVRNLVPGDHVLVGGSATNTPATLEVQGSFAISTTTPGCTQLSSIGILYSIGTACGSGGGNSFAFPFTSFTNYNATGTPIGFLAGLFSNGTTTINDKLILPFLPQGVAYIGSGNLLQSTATSTCPTFSTGLTYSGTAAFCIGGTNGNVTVNTTQNITNLSNLSTNGLVTTSGGNGTLGVTVNSTGGFVLAMANGVPTWVATTTFSGGLTYLNGNVTCTGCTGGTVTNVTGTYPIISSGGTTPNISTLFGTTTNWGMGSNGLITVGSSGIPYVTASSSLNLPNTALQNSSFSTSFTCQTGSASVALGGTFTLAQTNSIACGGTGLTAYPNNSIITSASDGLSLIATGTQLTVGNLIATTSASSFFLGNLGVGTSSPGTLFSVGAQGTGVNIVDNGTTTFSGKGIDLRNGGCFSVLGVCVGGGASGSGDITSVGDVASGAAFDGTQGTTLTFFGNTSGNATFLYDNAMFELTKTLAISTTTGMEATLIAASTTAPQVALSSGGGSTRFTLRNAGGNFYLATTSIAGNATTSLSALTVINNGGIGIFDNTPDFALESNGFSGNGYFGLTNTSDGDIFNVLSNGTVNVATTTNTSGASLSVIKSNGPQLSLGDGIAGNSQVDFRVAGNRLYIASTTAQGNATTTPPAFTIDMRTGLVGIGTSTPRFGLHMVGIVDNVNTNFSNEGLAGAVPSFNCLSANGTPSALTAKAINDFICIEGGKGYDGTGYSNINDIAIFYKADGAFTTASHPTRMEFVVTQSGTVSQTIAGTINNAGNLGMATGTPNFKLTGFSTTLPQLALSAGPGLSQWTFRTAGNALYIATTTVAGTFATSTRGSLEVTANGTIRFGNYADCGTSNALQISSNSVVCGAVSSDERLKKDFNKISPEEALEVSLALIPKTFWYKDPTYHNSMDAREQQGFIAQDVEKLIKDHPAMVSVLNKDENGYYTMDKSSLIPYLDGAIQALDAKINKIPQVAGAVKDRTEKNLIWIVIGLQFALFAGYVIYKEKYAK